MRALLNWVDSADVAGTDPDYVLWPEEGYIAAFNTEFVKSRMFLDFSRPLGGTKEDFNGTISSQLTTLFSLGLSYRGWGLSYSKDFSKSGDEQFSFCTYGQTYGAEFHIQNNHSYSGMLSSVVHPDIELEVKPEDIRQKLYRANIYYVFNHKHFSLPAALSQTVIQKRSAGSWLALMSYYRSVLSFKAEEFSKLKSTQISIGGGYAYNFVFARGHCLLHTSIMPSIELWHYNRIYYKDSKSPVSQNFSVDGLAHMSLVYNMSRYVMGCSSYYNYSWSNLSKRFSLIDLNWSGRVFIGVRF